MRKFITKHFSIGYSRTWAFSSFLLVLLVAILGLKDSADLTFVEYTVAFGAIPGLAALVAAVAGWNVDRVFKKRGL